MKILFISWLAGLLLLIATAVGAQSGDQFLRVSFVDVGQGDAIWIHGPAQADGSPGANVIIDGGPGRGAKNRLTKYLHTQSYGLAAGSIIDCVIATHPHNDHYPALMDVLAEFEVKTIIDSGFPKELTTPSGQMSEFGKFRDAALKEKVGNTKSKFVELRQTPTFQPTCGDLDLRILYTDNASATALGSGNTRENNASTVIRLTFGGFSFLFMGDAEGKERSDAPDAPHFVEQILLAEAKGHPELLKTTVLKVAHHGSETSSTLPFMRAVNPDILVIMSGRKAFSGTFLPDQAVIDRYKQLNPKIVIARTDQGDEKQGLDTTNDADGDDIYMYTDGDTLRAYQAVGKQTPRKWKLLKKLTAPEQ